MAQKTNNRPLQVAGAILLTLGALTGGYFIYKKIEDVGEQTNIYNIARANNIPLRIANLVKRVRSAVEGVNFTAKPTTINKITNLTYSETLQFITLYKKSYGIDPYTDIYIESDIWGQYSPALKHLKATLDQYNASQN